ncbi:MAG: hypothetical protein HY744_25790 [Deltaproteobacteria bacterium]|nr:hypothetical protein [Deltaproteobacteria bacterium]
MYIYILATLAFAVTASLIAYSKGRNSLGWFVCGLLIGPFALVVAALSPVARGGQFISCAACGEVIRVTATVCRHCGSAVPAAPPGAVPAERTTAEQPGGPA